MTEYGQVPTNPEPAAREPVFLLPLGVTALAGVMVLVHLASTFLLNEDWLLELYFYAAFQPYRLVLLGQDPGIGLPLLWTPFTHALLHADWSHLLLNTAWLVIFATPVTRRYGAGAMLALFMVSAAAGAAVFAATTLYDQIYLVGASGGVAGLTGAAIRFIFQPLLVSRNSETGEQVILGRRLASIAEVFRDSRARAFTLIWLLLNAAVPLVPVLTGTLLNVAWQAHLGGFLAGFLLVGLFERRR